MNSPISVPHQLASEMGTSVVEDRQARHHGNPREQTTLLVQRIKHPTVRQTVQVIFNDLLNLLECLQVLENLRQIGPSTETLAILDLFHIEACSLLDFIRVDAMNADGVDQYLAETLDGMAFVVGHDLQRAFEIELKGLTGNGHGDVSAGRLIHVHGLLTNCLQQAIITLAQVFDPRLDGATLFNNSQARLKQSLILCRDLANLIQMVHACEIQFEQQLATAILGRVKRFRNESMQFLMYKDWQEFEGFSEKLMSPPPGTTELKSLFHSFHCYLQTLFGQVKLRAVLADVFCDFFSDELDGVASDPDWRESETRLAFELFLTEMPSEAR